MVIHQYDICLVNLDPTQGSEIKKTRPCVVVSPDDLNKHLRTVQIAPMTSNLTAYPWRANMHFRKKKGKVALDQLRTVDKTRLIRKLGKVTPSVRQDIKDIIHEMLVE
jgi:mRNA interferase MazF